jgi:hypothetical protein
MSNSLARNSRSESGPTRQQLDELDALLQRMLDLPVNQADDELEEPELEPPPQPAPRPSRQIPAPEPNLPPVRYYEPEFEDELPPPGYPPTSTLIGAAETTAPEPANGRRTRKVPPLEPPVPGGRHDLEADTPVDPTEELARIRAQMQAQASLPPTANIPNPPRAEGGDWVPLRSWQPSAQTWKPLADRWEQAAPPVFPPRQSPSGPVVTTQTSHEPETPFIPPAPRVTRPIPAPSPVPPVPPPPTDAPPRSWALMPLVLFNATFDLVLLPWCPKGKFLRGPTGKAFLGFVGVICLLAAVALVVAEGLGWTW